MEQEEEEEEMTHGWLFTGCGVPFSTTGYFREETCFSSEKFPLIHFRTVTNMLWTLKNEFFKTEKVGVANLSSFSVTRPQSWTLSTQDLFL